MQKSDKYDKESNDRLVAAAVAFCEKHAKTFGTADAIVRSGGGGGGGGGGGSGSSGSQRNTDTSWKLVQGQMPEYVFSQSGNAEEDGKKPFACHLPWLDAFTPGLDLRFPTLVGISDGGLTFQLPTDEAIIGRTLAITARVDAAAVGRKQTTKTTNLQMKAQDDEPVERTREEIAASPTVLQAQAAWLRILRLLSTNLREALTTCLKFVENPG
jgi:hypothetical protein